MRRPKRTTPHVVSRIRWTTSASPGEPTPMDRLMSWLERHGEEFRMSKRKIELLEQLGEEMAASGIYGLTMSSIRSQLSRLKKGVQMRAEGGKCASTDVNRYYDRLLVLLFDEDERIEMRERAAEQVSEVKDRGVDSAKLPIFDPVLDTMEIRRRFELLSARQGLQQQGVDRETIDSFLPLRRE
ncbi:Hypothetical protein PHPALM_11477 [Phytophthora palmivora]|uniref:Uncharacterized protein n=1 Tax=Phytophthora palmivora TaxID=4796 RepID=A0A2P4Y248_9STRA|nr:Hypothetical protein PHPALM_11477 [Phytophthora palmivora]